jgi:hypothetical protein
MTPEKRDRIVFWTLVLLTIAGTMFFWGVLADWLKSILL